MRKQIIFVSIAAVLSKAAHAQLSWTYTYHDLGTNFIPNSISATNGYVVGYTTGANGPLQAYFTFVGNALTAPANIPLLTGSTLTNNNMPVVVNDYGSVVGTDGPTEWAYEWNLITQGAPVSIAPLASEFPTGLNNVDPSFGGQVCGYGSGIGMIWFSGGGAPPSYVDDPLVNGGHGVEFYGINNSDILFGFYYNANDTAIEITYNANTGVFTQLPGAIQPSAINNVGPGLCGTYNHATNVAPLMTYNPTACYWATPTSSPVPLDNAETGTSTASGINDSQYIVGSFTQQYPTTAEPYAYIYTPSAGMINLNTAVSTALPSGVILANGIGVDAAGDVIGTSLVLTKVGKLQSYVTHGFLLTVNAG